MSRPRANAALSVDQEPLYARLDLEVQVVGVRFVEVGRQHVRENAHVGCLTRHAEQLAAPTSLQLPALGPAALGANLAGPMRADCHPVAGVLLHRAKIDGHAPGVSVQELACSRRLVMGWA